MRTKSEEELSPRIAHYLDALRRVAPRDPRRAARTRARFVAQAVSACSAPRHKGWMFILFGKEWSMAQILVVLAVIVASLVGFTGTLYAAQDDLPGQALYPLKTWSEDVQVTLTADPSRQIERLMDLTQRRVEETVALTRAGREVPEAVLQRMERHLYQAMERSAAQGDEQMMRTLARVETRLRAMQQMLSGAPETPIRERVWTQLEAWRRLAQVGEVNPAQFRERIRERVRQNAPAAPESPGRRGPMGTPGTGPGPMETPGAGPGPGPMGTPGSGPGPMGTPGAGPGPMETPGTGPGPGPMETPGTGPGPGPMGTPGTGPGPMETPGAGLGPGPMETPGAGPGPGPMGTPGAGPGSGPHGYMGTPTPAPGGGH